LADAEGADAAIFAIEHVGRFVYGDEKPLETIGGALSWWVTRRLGHSRVTQFNKKLDLLRRGRNDRMHKGFAARSLTRDAVAVVMMLEEALMFDWSKYQATDLMTPAPTTAKLWMTFGNVRDVLVENAFSQVPIFFDGTWAVVSERTVARAALIARKRGDDLRNLRLEDSLPWDGSTMLAKELLVVVPTVAPDALVLDLDMGSGCVLVVRQNSQELLGIVTPSDIA
jgi:hypothetical protein